MKGPSILSDPNVLGAQPIVAGTRITVAFILDNLAAGRTPQQLIEKTPELTIESIEATKKFVLESVRQNNINTYRIPVRIRHLIVALEPLEVALRITEAFKNVSLGNGPSLRQMGVADNYGKDDQGREISRKGYADLRGTDETNNWTAITVDDLNDYDYLAYADGESFRFYIPALVIQGIAQRACSDVVYKLAPPKKDDGSWEYRMGQFSLLNGKQRFAIANFLWYLLDSYELRIDYGQTSREAEKALNEYWMQFLEPREEEASKETKARRK